MSLDTGLTLLTTVRYSSAWSYK